MKWDEDFFEKVYFLKEKIPGVTEIKLLMIDKEFVDWLHRQTNKTKDKVSNLNAQFLFCILLSIHSYMHIYLSVYNLYLCVTR